MKKLYSLFALGALLFAACSDNASQISGSTSVPNMGNNVIHQSPVLCSVMGVTDSLEAIEKGCIWSPEMWGPTTGYRVRTGYDNGTNTSGIWTVSTYPEDAEIEVEWPGNATAEYDSMALADAIDKCGGILCGTVLFKGTNNIPDHPIYQSPHRLLYIDFYLAGKDASGKFEGVDARDMGGICVSYSGGFYLLELIPDDSLAALMDHTTYNDYICNMGAVSKTDSSVKELCFSWDNFSFDYMFGKVPGKIYPSKYDVISHLKGFRFVLDGSYSQNDYREEFKIAGISRYNTPKVPTNNLHPVRTDCEPVAVMSSFCECDYTDDRIDILKGDSVFSSYYYLMQNLGDGVDSLSEPAKACFKSTTQELVAFFDKKMSIREKPCDNPIPHEVMCTDGTTSETLEYTEFMAEFNDRLAMSYQDASAIADSLFNYCMSLKD